MLAAVRALVVAAALLLACSGSERETGTAPGTDPTIGCVDCACIGTVCCDLTIYAISVCYDPEEGPPAECDQPRCGQPYRCDVDASEDECGAGQSGCVALRCPGCNGATGYAGCYAPDREPPCGERCPEGCAALDETACATVGGCHPLYTAD